MENPKITITQEFLQLIAEIDAFKGQWEAYRHVSPERLDKLRKVATIESVGSSTRIEGVKLSDQQIETLLSNLAVTSFKTRDEQEVAGYAEAMDLIFESYNDLKLTENHIRQLHKTLLRHSAKDERHRGDYKKLPNNVVAFDKKGKEIGIIFDTATPFDTPRKMEELVAWAAKAIKENSIHPLLMVSAFIVIFLAIHPFQDGNGRLSRILTTLLLLRAGYDYVPYASLEKIIEDNKDLYYKALRRTQTTLNAAAPDWEPWVGFFLRCLKKQKNNLAAKLSKDSSLSTDEGSALPELSSLVLKLLTRHERLSSAQLAEETGANRNTLKIRLRELVESGKIKRYGKGRATWYEKK
ncbi:MAG: Fic family protein [Bdellovibrionales bacterium]